jgi:hypothetical protein
MTQSDRFHHAGALLEEEKFTCYDGKGLGGLPILSEVTEQYRALHVRSQSGNKVLVLVWA